MHAQIHIYIRCVFPFRNFGVVKGQLKKKVLVVVFILGITVSKLQLMSFILNWKIWWPKFTNSYTFSPHKTFWVCRNWVQLDYLTWKYTISVFVIICCEILWRIEEIVLIFYEKIFSRVMWTDIFILYSWIFTIVQQVILAMDKTEAAASNIFIELNWKLTWKIGRIVTLFPLVQKLFSMC